jgi:hypothetical protein
MAASAIMFYWRSKVESMANWFRFILSVLALAGLLAAGTCGAFAAKVHHHCCPEMSSAMTMDDQAPGGSGHQNGPTPDCCVMGACAVAPIAAPHALVVTPAVYAQVALPAIDDAVLPSLSVSPDLRPPIA